MPSLEWLAGLFEGEGSVYIRRAAGPGWTGQLGCAVLMADREVLEWFHERFGGTLRAVRRRPGHQQAYSWSVHSRKAAAFLRVLRPYIQTGRVREKVDLALAFQAQKRNGGRPVTADYRARQDEFQTRLGELNARGREREALVAA